MLPQQPAKRGAGCSSTLPTPAVCHYSRVHTQECRAAAGAHQGGRVGLLPGAVTLPSQYSQRSHTLGCCWLTWPAHEDGPAKHQAAAGVFISSGDGRQLPAQHMGRLSCGAAGGM
jgi:hypothetical protein